MFHIIPNYISTSEESYEAIPDTPFPPLRRQRPTARRRQPANRQVAALRTAYHRAAAAIIQRRWCGVVFRMRCREQRLLRPPPLACPHCGPRQLCFPSSFLLKKTFGAGIFLCLRLRRLSRPNHSFFKPTMVSFLKLLCFPPFLPRCFTMQLAPFPFSCPPPRIVATPLCSWVFLLRCQPPPRQSPPKSWFASLSYTHPQIEPCRYGYSLYIPCKVHNGSPLHEILCDVTLKPSAQPCFPVGAQ